MAAKEITPQQKMFVDYYIKGKKSNATQAALDAGYSPTSACVQASQLLSKPKVKEYLREREAELERGLREHFAFDAYEARKVMFQIMTDPNASNRDRLTAARDFLDRAGYKPTDKVEHSGSAGAPLVLEIKL